MPSPTQLGTLYLIPVPIAEATYQQVLPAYVGPIVQSINHFVVEDIKVAKKYVYQLVHHKPISSIEFMKLPKQLIGKDISSYLDPLRGGQDVGVLSASGCPSIADPGAVLAAHAHQMGASVMPLVGPCSVLLSLMASGFNGQNFTFHGYLPIASELRRQAIEDLDYKVLESGQTQIFIETPYRNQVLLTTLFQICRPTTLLCLGKNLTHPDGWVKTYRIKDWQKNPPDLHKLPTVFLLGTYDSIPKKSPKRGY